MLTNVPTDLLRAFVTVVDLGSYTKAAEVLGRTQPAVSLQIRRLEEMFPPKGGAPDPPPLPDVELLWDRRAKSARRWPTPSGF